MSIDRAELQDAASKAFGEAGVGASSDDIWGLIAEMGWLNMTVPEELEGLGLGDEARGVIHTELGRVLAAGPVIAQMLVVEALAAADCMADRKALLEQATTGTVMTASLNQSLASHSMAADGSFVLHGTLHAVPDADKAERILVQTVAGGPTLLIPVDGLKVTYRETWDQTRRLFDVTLDGATADASCVIAQDNEAQALADRLAIQLQSALAADSLGGANAMLEQTVEYLKTRRQFDRPLALFQAIKHRCADLRTIISAGEALFWLSAKGVETSKLDAVTRAGALKAHATRVYQTVTEEAIQLHGGIGLTEEHPCHLFMKRAMLNAALGGSNDDLEEATGRKLLEVLAAA
jgi:alkylation response protein AidB-like acyl-CoA dehydrogenase